AKRRFPQNLPALRIERSELLIEIAPEHQVAGRREHRAVAGRAAFVDVPDLISSGLRVFVVAFLRATLPLASDYHSRDLPMTLETIRSICRALPAVTEDIKWGNDLCFSVAGKMFAVINIERPHAIAFKCTPESFGELVERPGIIPAPYMARNMWVQEQELGETLDRLGLEAFVRASYSLVIEKLPKSKRPGGPPRGARNRASGG